MTFHTVIIDAKLRPAKVPLSPAEPPPSADQHWFSIAKDKYGISKEDSLKNNNSFYTISNGPHTTTSSNAILEMFVSAYRQHHDIVLSPDDMWLVVCMYFGYHVNENAEQLRSLFVEHDKGKVPLKVGYHNGEYDWDNFFDAMKMQITKNTKNDVCEVLAANFSTTEKVESILSTACIMHTFQPYFKCEYGKSICGIRRAHFMGTLADWLSLREKTEQLKSFSTPKFHEYVNGLLPIFDQFIETYKGNINRRFWNKVCDIKREKIKKYEPCSPEFNRVPGQHITGWVLQLFGQKEVITENLTNISLPCIHVPVELEDKTTGKMIQCNIVGGFHGIYSVENLYKPVMSLSVIRVTNPLMLQKKVDNNDEDEDHDTHM